MSQHARTKSGTKDRCTRTSQKMPHKKPLLVTLFGRKRRTAYFAKCEVLPSTSLCAKIAPHQALCFSRNETKKGCKLREEQPHHSFFPPIKILKILRDKFCLSKCRLVVVKSSSLNFKPHYKLDSSRGHKRDMWEEGTGELSSGKSKESSHFYHHSKSAKAKRATPIQFKNRQQSKGASVGPDEICHQRIGNLNDPAHQSPRCPVFWCTLHRPKDYGFLNSAPIKKVTP